MLVGRQNSDAKSNEPSDITPTSDVDSLFSDLADAKAEAVAPVTPTHIGTVVVIDDIAFVRDAGLLPFSCSRLSNPRGRFQALLCYLYTNEVEFAPWGSAEGRGARALEETADPFDPPRPSPKSIYRLAGKVVMGHVAVCWN